MIEKIVTLPTVEKNKGLLNYLSNYFEEHFLNDLLPIRFVISKTDKSEYQCEIGLIDRNLNTTLDQKQSIFKFRKRKVENTESFNGMLLIPTGIGSELGGHAGDAGPVSRLFSSVCDNLILHPNVVNASDINEMNENSLYVEGSVLTRLLMGTVGLQKVRSNRVLMIMDNHKREIFANAAINSINAARATFGFNCPEIVKMEPPLRMWADYSESGRAAGRIEGIENLFKILEENKDSYDAVALSSVIKVPFRYHREYFSSEGKMINPWGGVEAMLTHAISHYFNIPSAHSPMFELEEIANFDPGIVDARMSAEAVSTTFLHCILKGLHKSPKIVSDYESMLQKGVISVEDISCIVIPDSCIGLPTLAALEQEIPVIAVEDNKNIMNNDLEALPWKENKFYKAKNYLEAAGIMSALKSGVSVESVLRPLSLAKVNLKEFKESEIYSESSIDT